jgi:hypothetical protein
MNYLREMNWRKRAMDREKRAGKIANPDRR